MSEDKKKCGCGCDCDHEHDHCDCGHDHEHCDCGCDDCESEFVTLTDENGVETEFEVIEGLEHDGTLYLALTEAANEDSDNVEFILLKVVEEGDESVLVSIDDEQEFNTVLELMQAKIESAGLFDFDTAEDK